MQDAILPNIFALLFKKFLISKLVHLSVLYYTKHNMTTISKFELFCTIKYYFI